MELVIQLYLYSVANEIDSLKRIMKLIRQREIDECFLRNLHHPLIKRFHILCENLDVKNYYEALAAEYPEKIKCIFTLFGKQPTYADIVRYVDTNIEHGAIVCIQNSDIYIDHAVTQNFLESAVTDSTLVALTRHEHTNEGHTECNKETCPLIWDYMGSHDTFLFRTPVPKEFPYDTLEYNQNVYGGETYFMKAWKDSGKRLYNPCFEVRIFHRHMHRFTFQEYPTIADGSLCYVNPVAPQGRPDIANKLQTLYKN